MIDSALDYVDPQKVRENTTEFLAKGPQKRSQRAVQHVSPIG